MREHRVFAALYDRLGRRAERGPMGRYRRELLADASGSVLEVGAGTGANLADYPEVERLTLTEPDGAMRRRLAPRAAEAPFPVELEGAPAEALPAADRSVDTVVSTLVLCSVDDPDRALAEMRRVLRPGGRFLFLEHVRGEGGTGRLQDRLVPLWRRMFGGCHPNRRTVDAIRRAGFGVVQLRELQDIPSAPWLKPVVAGVAVAPAEG
jgi:ubiquinone/menaquinone biosynthesis C-methylase UbiE